MEQRFKVGDKVIALSSSTRISQQPRVIGEKYVVADVRFCRSCGKQTISLQDSPLSVHQRSQCGCGQNEKSTKMWSYSSLFILDNPKELAIALEEAVKEENYELASILRDVLAEKETA